MLCKEVMSESLLAMWGQQGRETGAEYSRGRRTTEKVETDGAVIGMGVAGLLAL